MSDDVILDEEGQIVEQVPPKEEAPPEETPAEETPAAEAATDETASGEVENEETAGDEETPEEAEARRARNRARRESAKQHRKEHLESLKRELAARDRIINEMNQRLATVERKSSGSEMAQLDQAEREAAQAYNHFKDINAKAIEQANGQIAIEAQEKMFLARQRMDQIKNIRTAMQSKEKAPQPLDPRLLNHAQDWMSKNKWYDPKGSDQDSAIVLTLDNRLASEGWDPTTPEYWSELNSRVQRVLPHRANLGYNSRNVEKRNAPPPVTGSGREGSNSAGKGTYTLSADRVTALKEAGLWDDPKQRADAIKRFQQYDKEHKA